MPELLRSILEQVGLNTVIDIGITALLIYALFSLIRGTRAVRLVIGVSAVIVVYWLAVVFNLVLLTAILQGGAVVGLFALVVVFQPELRRALERIGRVGSFGWLSADGHGALIVIERETGLEEVAETGIMIHGDLSADLLRTIFSPKTALHDGAVIIREESILAAGALLPLAETSIHTERFGTRHRAALGIAEQTDALVVVVSEENSHISLVERSRITRNLTEAGLATALQQRLDPASARRSALSWRTPGGGPTGSSSGLGDLGRFLGRTRPAAPPPPADDESASPAAAQAPR